VPTLASRIPVTGRRARRRGGLGPSDPLPLVEIVLDGVNGDDWVTDTLRSQGLVFRMLGCRPADRGRRRLVRLFEIQADGAGIGPAIRRLRARVAARDIAVSTLGSGRALLRVAVPMPAICSAAFDMGDFCMSCPLMASEQGLEPAPWNVLVPQIVDARRLLRASARPGGPRPSLVRAGAYRKRWGLTGRQEKALRLAFQMGYFDYPRKAPLSTIAARLGVGRSAALELLRKATTKLAAQRFQSEPAVDCSP